LVASPCFASRLHTTGHFLHRGPDLQQRFFGLIRFTASSVATPLGLPKYLRRVRVSRTRLLCPGMPADTFVTRLNEQIGHEFAAHQQYLAIAVHYDAETLPQLARFFYRQAVEERDHALMMIQYLIDADADVLIPGVAAPQARFGDIVAPVALALEQERRVTEQINGLAAAAREAGDYTSEQFMQWFIKEQVEEVATMSDLLRVVERSKDDPMEIENFMAREFSGEEGEDPTAPHVAGAE
jgi:bacterioferritin B